MAPLGGVDCRRFEVVAERLPVFHGAQLAWTLLCALMEYHTANVPPLMVPFWKPPAAQGEDVLSGTQGRARLVVLAAEVGGRWSEESRCFICLLARAKVRSLPKIVCARAQQSWHLRWGRCRESSGIFAPRKPRESWHGWPDAINIRRHERLASFARRGRVIGRWCMRRLLVRLSEFLILYTLL